MGLQELKSFSEREGFIKARVGIQIESMDAALRSRLWNVLDYFYWAEGGYEGLDTDTRPNMMAFLNKMWHYFYKEPVDNISYEWENNRKLLKARFFEVKWHEVYDFVEFIANNYPDEAKNMKFVETCNQVLKEELSAYRFVGKKITKITSETEISEIEEALKTPLETVNAHLRNALDLMSDRKSPDFRNSIKDSISAVEALCRLIADDKDATLGKALDAIGKGGKIELHGALRKAFDSIYGYTSTAEGIRHAFMDDKVSVDFEDAKFMLVSCSAFVNYLIVKASKAGIKLK